MEVGPILWTARATGALADRHAEGRPPRAAASRRASLVEASCQKQNADDDFGGARHLAPECVEAAHVVIGDPRCVRDP